MNHPALHIPAGERSPEVYVHVNPLYALYHYLVEQGMEPGARDAAGHAAAARHLLGVHGIWDEWEIPLASAATTESAVSGLRSRMTETIDSIGSALRDTEAEWREQLWPDRAPLVEAALATLRETLQPRFAGMARRQGELLDLPWPERIDAYLVTDCYDWRKAYSHPLTIDIRANTGFTLCETLLHEATHVADVYISITGRKSLGSRLGAHLNDAGVPGPTAWNAWHAVIFAASAWQVRQSIDPNYTDYAVRHGLYDFFHLPDLPDVWQRLAQGSMDESGLLRAIAQRLRAA